MEPTEFPVVLISPDGTEWTANSLEQYANLVYGRGFQPKDPDHPSQASKSASKQKQATQAPSSAPATPTPPASEASTGDGTANE